jgi:hypothetical protein
LGEYVVNLSSFEEGSIICDSDEVPNQKYHRIEDQVLVFMKSNPLSENVPVSESADDHYSETSFELVSR